MFRHLSKHHCLPEEHLPPTNCCHTLRSFHLVKDAQRTLPSSALNAIPWTRQIHHVKGLGNCQLKMCNMACFCNSCLLIKEGSCMSSHVVNDWVTTKVSFTRTWRDDPANQRKEPVSSVSSAPVTPLSEDSAPVTPLSEDSAPVTPLSEDPAPNTAPDPNPFCRKTFFNQLQNEMAAATSYAGVHITVVRTAEAVKNLVGCSCSSGTKWFCQKFYEKFYVCVYICFVLFYVCIGSGFVIDLSKGWYIRRVVNLLMRAFEWPCANSALKSNDCYSFNDRLMSFVTEL